MNFTGIDDPAGVKALLEQLRTSQAWRDALNDSPDDNPSTSTPTHISTEDVPRSAQVRGQGPDASRGISTSVAALLSQLQASPTVATALAASPGNRTARAPTSHAPLTKSTAVQFDHEPSDAPSVPTQHARADVRSCTFQQALPHLARMSDSPDFVTAIAQLKSEQGGLERQLWEERCAIQKKHEEKIKVAQTRASMIGVGLTKHEATIMAEDFRKELSTFDVERVLPAWDGLVTKQQATLFALGVPTMFVTNTTADRKLMPHVIPRDSKEWCKYWMGWRINDINDRNRNSV